ncbi:Conserved oligomeric Golgi complex component 4,putative, partial [Schistosoma mansoni]
ADIKQCNLAEDDFKST